MSDQPKPVAPAQFEGDWSDMAGSGMKTPLAKPVAPSCHADAVEIRVGSTWLDRSVLGPSHSVKVETVHGDGGGVNLLKDTGWRFAMTTVAFRHAYKWLSDPDPTAETKEM